MDTQSIIESLLSQHQILAGLIIFASSIIEYIFPPFPGDTVTLAGAILVGLYGWNFILVFALVTSGSILGSIIDYFVGRFLYNYKSKWLSGGKKREKFEKGINIVLDKFKKHGEIYIILNRFLPGIRAFFFVAAGLSRLNLLKVAFYSSISACLWNLAIITAGYFLGKNISIIENILIKYNFIVSGLIIIFIVCVIIWVIKKLKHQN